jgi:hypothetical protein
MSLVLLHERRNTTVACEASSPRLALNMVGHKCQVAIGQDNTRKTCGMPFEKKIETWVELVGACNSIFSSNRISTAIVGKTSFKSKWNKFSSMIL